MALATSFQVSDLSTSADKGLAYTFAGQAGQASGEEVAQHLRHQVNTLVSEKDKDKIELESLRRVVEHHLSRLNELLSEPSCPRERLQMAVSSFDQDLSGRLTSDDSVVEGQGTYDVLRGALTDSQRRCQILNNDMLRVADANDELMTTLKKLKGTNKRLVEEVQSQTEELATLTQQRLLDNENLNKLHDSFANEHDLWSLESNRAIEETTQRGEAELQKLRSKLVSQLQEFQKHAYSAKREAELLRKTQMEIRSEAETFVQTMKNIFKKTDISMQQKISAAVQRTTAELARVRDVEHHLSVKLRSENEVREQDLESWKLRYSQLNGEQQELVVRRNREVSLLQEKVSTIVADREADSQALLPERQRLQETSEQMQREISSLESATQTGKRQLLVLERKCTEADSERTRLTQTMESLKQQIRESDDALSEAVKNNDSLREQMEVQRLDSHNANERDFKLCRDMFEKRLDSEQHHRYLENQDASSAMHRLQEKLGFCAGEIETTREKLSETSRSRETLQRDAAMWKAQQELAAKMLTDVEKESAKFRQEIGIDLSQLREAQVDLAARKDRSSTQKTSIVQEAREAQQSLTAFESVGDERIAKLTAQQQEVVDELYKVRTQTADVERKVAIAKAEEATHAQQTSERRDFLQQEIANVAFGIENMRRDLERQLLNDRQNSSIHLDSFEKLKGETDVSLRAASEGPLLQLAALEATALDMQRRSDQELTSLRRQLDRTKDKASELEVELGREQAKLTQTEEDVRDFTQRLNHTKQNNRNVREALERERQQKMEDLRVVQQKAQQKADHIKAATKSAEEVRKRMLKEIDDQKREAAKSIEDAERKTKLVEVEYSSNFEEKEARMRHSSETIRERLDGISKENDQLRKFVSEHQYAARNLQDVGSHMHRHLTSMESRAHQLRSELQY